MKEVNIWYLIILKSFYWACTLQVFHKSTVIVLIRHYFAIKRFTIYNNTILYLHISDSISSPCPPSPSSNGISPHDRPELPWMQAFLNNEKLINLEDKLHMLTRKRKLNMTILLYYNTWYYFHTYPFNLNNNTCVTNIPNMLS